MSALASAEGSLSAGLGRLLALSESYPDLKANTTMRDLSEELTSTENKVAFARQAYNDSVTEYNSAREMFPAVMFAASFGFTAAALLEVIEAPAERQAPKVAFS
jgi:LemA protein